MFSLFFFVMWLTETHIPKYYQGRVKYFTASYIKSLFLLVLINQILLNAFIKNPHFIKGATAAVFEYSVLIILFYSLLFLIVKRIRNEDMRDISCPQSKYEQIELPIAPETRIGKIEVEKIKNLLFYEPSIINELFSGNENAITSDFRIIDEEQIKHRTKNNIEICIIDYRLNDIKNINNFLASIYASLIPGGLGLFVYQELEVFEKKFLNKFGKFKIIGGLFYYIYYRAFPKIPFINSFYALVSNGKNKVLSKAEIWGRLYYAGFDIKKQIEKKDLTYIVVRKERQPSLNPNPSFYPIISLNRVGLYGKIIKIHKVRSMYPYSEFLQKKVFEENNLSSIGKFGNDFRITKLGKYYRKFWIDELPQILDWFRGEIKLVGIRALSQHFYSLYSKEYQDLFIKVKPGIISPIFDENTAGFDHIEKVEMNYLKSYLTNPIRTDFKYFFITFQQILSGVRSK